MHKQTTLIGPFLCLALGAPAIADVHSWTGATDEFFNTPGNWSPTGPPDVGDSIVHNNTTGNKIIRVNVGLVQLSNVTVTGGDGRGMIIEGTNTTAQSGLKLNGVSDR